MAFGLRPRDPAADPVSQAMKGLTQCFEQSTDAMPVEATNVPTTRDGGSNGCCPRRAHRRGVRRRRVNSLVK